MSLADWLQIRGGWAAFVGFVSGVITVRDVFRGRMEDRETAPFAALFGFCFVGAAYLVLKEAWFLYFGP